VDRAKIRVLEQTDQISLGSFLESSDGGRLETKIGLEVLSDLTDQTLERQLADQKLGRFLVSSDFSESDGSGSVTVGLLDAASGRRALPGGLGGELLARRFAAGRLPGGLLGTSHDLTDGGRGGGGGGGGARNSKNASESERKKFLSLSVS